MNLEGKPPDSLSQYREFMAPPTASCPRPMLLDPLLTRLRDLALATDAYVGGDIRWLEDTAKGVMKRRALRSGVDGFAAHFFDDLQTLDRLTERFGLQPSLRAFAQVSLFMFRAEMIWLVVAEM
jgi:hypothetical protein